MTREQIIANSKTGAERLASGKFGVTPANPKHTRRFLELKQRTEQDKKHNDEALADAPRAQAYG
jgi:hypothetical protein